MDYSPSFSDHQLSVVSKLKHLHRGPVNLQRVPDHLWTRVIQKHPASTQLNLSQVSLRTSEIVDQILDDIPLLQMLSRAFSLVPKRRLFDSLTYSYYFPPENGRVFREWARSVFAKVHWDALRGIDDDLHRAYPDVKAEISRYYGARENPSNCKDWKPDNFYGPQRIDLNFLPRTLWQRAMIKSAYAPVSRIASTCSKGKLAADTCLRSSKEFEFHERCHRFSRNPLLNYEYYMVSVWQATIEFSLTNASKYTNKEDRERVISAYFVTDEKFHQFKEYVAEIFEKYLVQKKAVEKEIRSVFGYTLFLKLDL